MKIKNIFKTGYITRGKYWSLSRFSTWVLGEETPFALQMHEWDEWYADVRHRKPMRYWFTKTFLNKLQNFVMYPRDVYTNITYFIRNIKYGTHCLGSSKFALGEWHDLSERLYICTFDSLVAFRDTEFYGGWDEYYKWVTADQSGKEDYERIPEGQVHCAKEIHEICEWWENYSGREDYDRIEEMMIRVIKIREGLWT